MSSDFIILLMEKHDVLEENKNRKMVQKFKSVDEILNKPASAKITYYTLEQLKSEFD